MADFSEFICDKCGACCQTLLVEAAWYDAIREPRIMSLTTLTEQDLRQLDNVVVLYDTDKHQCPFLRDDTNECDIYPTRPTECVMVAAGDAKCQQARKMKGLGTLRDSGGRLPTRSMLLESCEKYGLDYDEWFLEDNQWHNFS
jgi:Fe-S-cluster containining protein